MGILAEELKQIRLTSGVSQAEFAKKIGVSQRTWSAYESGETIPKAPVIMALTGMGYRLSAGTTGIHGSTEAASELLNNKSDIISVTSSEIANQQDYELFRFQKGITVPIKANNTDDDAVIMLPLYSQTASAGPGQPETQLQELEKYIPIVVEMLGGANPKNCGIIRVTGDSMIDMSLFNGDWVIFDRTQIDGNGVYVISIGSDVRIKRLEYRPFERKIIISSENTKRYPTPEIISYEQAEEMLRIHGKVICWMHRHPY